MAGDARMWARKIRLVCSKISDGAARAVTAAIGAASTATVGDTHRDPFQPAFGRLREKSHEAEAWSPSQ